MSRRKGCLGTKTLMLKTMILRALDKVGGEDYLVKQAKENPTAFLTLIGKTLPLALPEEGSGSLVIKWEK